MIHLKKGETSRIILTLSEMATLNSPNYLFVFQSRTSNDQVKFVILNSADLSDFKDRFNAFNIIVNNHFEDMNVGGWSYKVYEQVSTTNLDPTLSTGLLETGQMTLSEATIEPFKTYKTAPKTYKTRKNG
jgi:hypothetical protein